MTETIFDRIVEHHPYADDLHIYAILKVEIYNFISNSLEKHKISLRELSRRINFDVADLSRIKNGKTQVSLKKLSKIIYLIKNLDS